LSKPNEIVQSLQGFGAFLGQGWWQHASTAPLVKTLKTSRKMRGAMPFHQGDTAAGCRVVLLQIAYWRRELGQVKYAQQEKIAEDGEHLRP
jgi:hypothetical protein